MQWCCIQNFIQGLLPAIPLFVAGVFAFGRFGKGVFKSRQLTVNNTSAGKPCCKEDKA